MAAFQQGTIHIKEKTSIQSSADPGWLRIYAKIDGNVYRKDESGVEYRFMGSTEVASISAGLQAQIGSISVSAGGSSSSSPLNITGGNASIPNVSILEFNGTAVTSVQNLSGGHVLVTLDKGVGASTSAVVVSGAGTTFYPDGNADVYDYYLTGATTIYATSALGNGRSILISCTQPISGGAPLTLLPYSGMTWKLPNGTLTLSTDFGNATDVISVLRINSNLFATIVKNYN